MEIEPSQSAIAKKLWNVVRIAFYMIGKGLSRSKLMLDLHLMLKRGKVASKALSNLVLHHHHYASTLSCRSNDVGMSFISPREYEFSCSNSPVYPSYYTRRKHHHHHQHQHQRQRQRQRSEDVNVAQKMFEILNNYESVEASPLINLPGFGRSPMVRQLRVTDSPFPIKDTEENGLVDKAAEEFIKNFYKQLKQQKRIESPSPYHKRGR